MNAWRLRESGKGTMNLAAPCGCGCGQKVRGGYAMGHGPISSYREAGYKRLHVVRAERALGKPLPKGAEVHHADGSKRDDAPLVICQDKSYHKLLHVRTRIVRAGGNPDTQVMCSGCQRPKDFDCFHRRKSTHMVVSRPYAAYCKSCQSAIHRKVAS